MYDVEIHVKDTPVLGASFFVYKGGRTMNNVIKVTPNSKGEIFITLYGTKYQIVIEEPKKPAKAKAE